MQLAFTPEIPSELVDMVIDFCKDDVATLQNASLVDRSWLPRASVNIFSHITLTQKHGADFFALMDSPKSAARIHGLIKTLTIINPDLAPNVPWLWTPGQKQVGTGRQEPSELEIPAERSTMFSSVSVLIIQSPHGFHGAVNLHPEAFQLLRELGNVNSLTISGFQYLNIPLVLDQFPVLQYLIMDLAGSHLSDHLSETEPNLSRLHGLRLDCQDLVNITAWLGHLHPAPPIETLHLDKVVPGDLSALQDLSYALEESLRHLRLAFYDSDGEDYEQYFEDLNIGHLSCLQTLQFIIPSDVEPSDEDQTLFIILKVLQKIPAVNDIVCVTLALAQPNWPWPVQPDLLEKLDSVLDMFSSLRSVRVFIPPEELRTATVTNIHASFPRLSARESIHIVATDSDPSSPFSTIHPRLALLPVD